MAQWRVLIVSADRPFASRASDALHADSSFAAPEAYADGASALSAIRSASSQLPTLVVVDSALSDMSPLNLIGGITSVAPWVGVLFLTPVLEDVIMNKAMLAGARAVVHRDALDTDFIPAVKRVAASIVNTVPGKAHSAGGNEGTLGKSIAVVGAKGGAGRTTVASLLGFLAAGRGLDVALFDLDLQFGDVTFVFDVQPKRTLVDMVRDLDGGLSALKPYGTQLADGLTLYSTVPQPEQAEVVAPKAGLLIRKMCEEHDLVVINTGAFWTLLHAEIIDAADQSLFVMNPTAVSVRATVRARGLCTRLGIPDAQLSFVVNRTTNHDLITATDISHALRCDSVFGLVDGGQQVAEMADSGRIGEALRAKGSFPGAAAALADNLLKRVNLTAGSVTAR